MIAYVKVSSNTRAKFGWAIILLCINKFSQSLDILEKFGIVAYYKLKLPQNSATEIPSIAENCTCNTKKSSRDGIKYS